MNFTIPAAMIQKWIDNPSENAGLLARAFIPFVAVGQFRMYSSEIGTAGLRPTLTFDYAVVPEPATIGLVVIGAVALVVRRRR